MLFTFEVELKKMVAGQDADWEEFLPQVLLGYQCHRHATGLSPFELIFWLLARMNQSDPVELIPGSSEESPGWITLLLWGCAQLVGVKSGKIFVMMRHHYPQISPFLAELW